MRKSIVILASFFFAFFAPLAGSAQNCDSLVPSYVVDLSSNPDSTWISPAVARAGNCCGTIAPETCIEFNVTISPVALGVIVHIYSTNLLIGSLLVNVECSSQVPVDDTIFFPTTGPYSLSFCRPGNSIYQYGIQSIPASLNNLINYHLPNKIIIYPNPAENFVILESTSPNPVTYNLVDTFGKTVLSGVFEKTHHVNLASVSQGFYFIECISNKNLTRHKIVKE